MPIDLDPLRMLRTDLYSARTAGEHSYLNPLYVYAIREASALPRLRRPVQCQPVDRPIAPSVTALPEDGVTARVHGLLVRFWPAYEAGAAGARWVHSIVLPSQSLRERHPVVPGLTDELADAHREMLFVAARLAGGADGTVPGVVAQVGPEERGLIDGLHARSDWVLTLDRFLRPEFYDDPGDPDMARMPGPMSSTTVPSSSRASDIGSW